MRHTLQFGERRIYEPTVHFGTWDLEHRAPGEPPGPTRLGWNVLPDLAAAMKQNPNLKVQIHNGYYDLVCTYFIAVNEARHLPMPRSLYGNVEMHTYDSGHMVYLHEPDLKALHDNVAAFIDRTKSGDGG